MLLSLLPDVRRRIAVTGLFNSGKTVFLTSLLAQLTNHSAGFALDPSTSDWKFNEVAVPKDRKEFSFNELHRSLIDKGEFPAKTYATSEYHATLRPGAKQRRYRIELVDCPGERFADAGIYQQAYADWSDRLLQHWQIAASSEIASYLTECSGDEATLKTVNDAYRLLLATKLANYEPLIVPSTFKLSESGKGLKGKSVEAILSQQPICGLEADSEFAPLPKAVRASKPIIAKAMEKNYVAYQREIVNKFFNRLSWCDRLVVLIDIPSLLAAGSAAINDNVNLLRTILEKLKPSENAAKRAVGWWFGGIQKVAFVATKSDLVCEHDIEQLASLLRQMVYPIKVLPDYVEQEFFVVSSVVSTTTPTSRPLQNGTAWLRGRLTRDYTKSPPPVLKRAESAESDFEISRLPSNGWPTSYSAGSFAFPDVYPMVPEAQFIPPDHRGLESVFKFIVK